MSGPSQTSTPVKRILVASTFTATPLEQALEFWFEQLGLNGQAAFPGYQQLFQQLLNPDGDFARNIGGVNVALFRLDDLGDSDWEASLHELVTALIGASKRLSTPLLVCACPSRKESVNESVVQQLTGYRNLYVVDADHVIADYQITDVYDAVGERAAHLPYTVPFYTGLATQIMRTVVALDRPPMKVIAVDCDNTLWSGVCGEDGPEGVTIDHGRRTLQERLIKLKSCGALVALVSKNNEADVCETFAKHPDMALRWTDINGRRINWQAKSWNLVSLAHELNLGLASFVFLEDDAKEAAEVRQGSPQVNTIQIPAASEALPQFLKHLWILDQVRAPTAEDEQRSKRYSEEAERRRYQQQSANFKEFVRGLNLRTEFLPVNEEFLPRASQLTLRTNQMNTTLERLSEPQLLALTEDANVKAWVVSVSDRFGDYGVVGLLVLQLDGDTTVVRNLVLSCRALGRGVEHRMLAHAAQAMVTRFVEVPAVAGPRNNPAIGLLRRISFGTDQDNSFRFEAQRLACLEFDDTPAREVQPPHSEDASSESMPTPSAASSTPNADYQRIASEFTTADRILRAIARQSKSVRPHQSPVFHAPQTELEHDLAAIWCELLGINRIDVEDDFFDLGGHSLLAVQLLSRIHRDLDVELPDSVIYADKLRISSLARAIELHRLGFGDQEGFESALAEIEALSDEEVARLLSEETIG